ncbi:hypothetical protein DLM75_06240 [Leptospira stimsonii]|uniref:Uncharacterized protein n=1 Tax=Leptospira stimsonii TaxID=2202203 RepID=A0A396ZG97_9LEPT|nr:hypothetical protein DLM75_06240 [Leptospira stimsonii]
MIVVFLKKREFPLYFDQENKRGKRGSILDFLEKKEFLLYFDQENKSGKRGTIIVFWERRSSYFILIRKTKGESAA